MEVFQFSSALRQRGITLVELLVAMFLGVLLLFGVLKVFDSSREGARVQRALAAAQDSGRIAIEFLARDIRNADFSGCLADKNNLTNGLNLDSGAPDFGTNTYRYYDLGAVLGDTASPGQMIGSKEIIEDTDLLQLVGARPICDGVINLGADQINPLSPLSLAEECEIPNGTVLLVASCQRGDIFVKTAGDYTNIQHSTVVVEGISNANDALSTAYTRDTAYLYKPYVYTYFVAEGANGNNALFRREDDNNFELIPNVDDFQITFGVDRNSDGLAEDVVDPSGITSVEDSLLIISVKTSVTVQSPEQVNGSSIRRTYTATTNVRNRSVESNLAINN